MKKKKKIPLRYRFLFFAVLAVVISGAVGTIYFRNTLAEKKRRQAFDNLTANSIEHIAELAVLEYRYTDVMELNRTFIIGGGSTSLVRFSGIVKAGIANISNIRVSYEPQNNRISITLPQAQFLDNTVDVETLKIWDLKRSLFVPISTELKIQEVALFKETVAKELRASGFLEEAN
ncbi:MAG TPA: DUF4230 domain-containing protein, partial [Treponema sp.]|nr:DUF4230 domain-containing protein [Treponema sp.]